MYIVRKCLAKTPDNVTGIAELFDKCSRYIRELGKFTTSLGDTRDRHQRILYDEYAAASTLIRGKALTAKRDLQ
jgi:hypothetical protein